MGNNFSLFSFLHSRLKCVKWLPDSSTQKQLGEFRFDFFSQRALNKAEWCCVARGDTRNTGCLSWLVSEVPVTFICLHARTLLISTTSRFPRFPALVNAYDFPSGINKVFRIETWITGKIGLENAVFPFLICAITHSREMIFHSFMQRHSGLEIKLIRCDQRLDFEPNFKRFM